MTRPDYMLFVDDEAVPPIPHDERAKQIAEVLYSGKASDIFMKMLAEAIRPGGRPVGVRFVLKYDRRGRRRKVDVPLPHDERAKQIAEVLYSGKASDTFMKMLAEAIRPGSRPVGVRFVLKYDRRGPRRDPHFAEVGLKIIRLVKDEDLGPDVAVAEVQAEFGKSGHSRSTCMEAYKDARQWDRAERLLRDLGLLRVERNPD